MMKKRNVLQIFRIFIGAHFEDINMTRKYFSDVRVKMKIPNKQNEKILLSDR